MISGTGTLELFKVISNIASVITVDPTVLSYQFFEGINFGEVWEKEIHFIKYYNESHN